MEKMRYRPENTVQQYSDCLPCKKPKVHSLRLLRIWHMQNAISFSIKNNKTLLTTLLNMLNTVTSKLVFKCEIFSAMVWKISISALPKTIQSSIQPPSSPKDYAGTHFIVQPLHLPLTSWIVLSLVKYWSVSTEASPCYSVWKHFQCETSKALA